MRVSVAQAEQTASQQLRAYLFVAKATIFNVGSTLPIYVYAVFKNSGQTPVYKGVARRNIVCGYPLRSAKLSLSEDWQEVPFLVGPKSFNTLRCIRPSTLSDEQVSLVRSGVYVIYFYGDGMYTDVFGTEQTFESRFFYGGIGPASRESDVMIMDGEGNEYT
jgi:hypothetical protein